MKKLLPLLLILSAPAWATDPDPITHEETAAAPTANRAEWDAALKEKYHLTDQQLQDLRAKGLNNPQIAIVSQLSQASGKTTEEILKMRQEQHMGWGKIAKELGVHPGEIGRAVSSVRHAWHEDRTEARQQSRQERREERRHERQNRRGGRGKSD
jgi:hypothetical protein